MSDNCHKIESADKFEMNIIGLFKNDQSYYLRCICGYEHSIANELAQKFMPKEHNDVAV